MLEIYLLSLFVVTLLFYLMTRKPTGYPPGPKWWPVVGCALEVARVRKKLGFMVDVSNALAERYGPVVGLKIGNDLVVLLNDLPSIKAMYANDDCDGKPVGVIYEERTLGARRGLLAVDGRLWMEQRRFVLRHLREFGLGREAMATIAEEEAVKLVEHFRALLINNNILGKNKNETDVQEGKHKQRKRKDDKNDVNPQGLILPMHTAFGVSVINSLWMMMANKRYNHNNEELIYLQRILTKLMEEADMLGAPFSHFPILRRIAPEWSGYKLFVDTHLQLWKYLEDELDNHKRCLDPAAPRDLMDVYLLALKTADISDTFSDSQLLGICLDLFVAGSETTSKALGIAFMYLLLNREVQKKAQTEIDRVIGRDRFPRLEDRSQMPYVNAVIFESLRMFMSRNLNIPHRAMRDTHILQHRIPKNTMVVVNYNAVLMDKEIWKDPEVFRPERFFDEKGNVVTPDEYFPFSLARHRCMGEVLAKCNMFLIITALLQTFEFSIVPGEENFTPRFIDAVTSGPAPYRALITLRY